jgi:hypothetical protein
MSFDLGPQLLEVLHDGAVDRSTEVCMLVCDDAGFVADAVVYILCPPTISDGRQRRLCRWARGMLTYL